MTKRELKVFMRIYPLVSSAVEQKETAVTVILCGRKRKINIPVWACNYGCILGQVKKSQNNAIIGKIIDGAYVKGKNDKEVLLNLPLSESSYYRIKRKIDEVIYELFIANCCVTQADILKNKINI